MQQENIQRCIEEYFAEHALKPFNVTRIVDNHKGNCYVYIKEEPYTPSKQWLQNLKNNIGTEYYKRIIYTGGCSLLSLAVALAMQGEVKMLRVRVSKVPMKTKLVKVYCKETVEPDNLSEEHSVNLWSDFHHVIIRKFADVYYVLDLTGIQYGWSEKLLFRWIKLSDYTRETGVSYNILEDTHSPIEYMNRPNMSEIEKDHVAAAKRIAQILVDKDIFSL